MPPAPDPQPMSTATLTLTVGMPAMALIRSGGLLFVRAANEGRTVIEMFPKEKVSEDFDALADRLLGAKRAEPVAKAPFRIFNRATGTGPIPVWT